MSDQLECTVSATKSSDFKHIVGMRHFGGGGGTDYCAKIFCFWVHTGALDLIHPGTSLYEHILRKHLENNRTYARTFTVQHNEINVV